MPSIAKRPIIKRKPQPTEEELPRVGAVTEAQLIASLCRASFKDFVKEFWKTTTAEPLQWNWHMDVMCEYLQKLAERVFLRLPKERDFVCNVAPGTSKSTIFSILFPAWVWTRMPAAQIIGASYAHPLALDLARKCRDVIKSELYRACFPEIKLREDQDTKGYFANTAGGYRYAVGGNGTVQGMHGHFIILDDPLNPNQAISEADLNQINYWIKTTLSGRKVNKLVSVTILVMQRLAQNDPTGQMLEKGEGVYHICIPSELTENVKPADLRSRYIDGLMDPVRMPRDFLMNERKPASLGEFGYASQHLQTPVPLGGGAFKTKRLRIGPVPGKFKRVVRYWDKAVTPEKAGGRLRGPAWTVGVKMAQDYDDNVWVLNVIRKRLDSAARERLIRTTAWRDGHDCVVGIEQEPGSGGRDSAVATVKRLIGYRVRPIPASGSKETRADEFSNAVNNGIVFLPQSMRQDGLWMGWAKEYVEELTYWPFSTFKDQGDASGGAFNLLARTRVRVGPLRPSQEKQKSLAVSAQDRALVQRRVRFRGLGYQPSGMMRYSR